MSKLVSHSKVSEGLASRMNPSIQTRANPGREWLLQARAEVRSNEVLQQAFVHGKQAPDQAVARISMLLNTNWGGDCVDEADEAAQYLWDEYNQLGEGIHLVSNETGKVITTLTEDDIYQPAMVPRESGSMAKPLPRIKPGLDGMITTWIFEQEREANIIQTLSKRLGETELLRTEGDPRLLVASRAGREQMVKGLSQFDSKTLLKASGGTTAAFLRHFELTLGEPDLGPVTLDGEVSSRSVLQIQDPTAINLHHNRAASLRGALVQGWVREIARRFSVKAHNHFQVDDVPVAELTKDHLRGCKFWVSPPECLTLLLRIDPTVQVLPVSGAKLIGFQGHVGTLAVPVEFDTKSGEWFDRWEASAFLKFKLWANWDVITPLSLSGVGYEATVVERR